MFKILVLIGMVKFLMASRNPLLSAGFYIVASVLIGLMWGLPINIVGVTVGFVLAFAYFWLLLRFEDSALWWVILIVGALIGAV